ncbi:MAG: glycosyltransferase WbuB [Micavibrio sp.]|nr:glycosyltransferase WbuB [Micavibrio sp.]
MRRPTVLFINRVYPPQRGASGRVLRDLARSFAREGWQVNVITTGPSSKIERDGAVKITRIKAPAKPRNTLSYMLVWLKVVFVALRLPSTHLVVTMTDPPMLVVAGQVIRFFKRNRHIHWCQDLYPDVIPSLGIKMPIIFRWFFHGLSRRSLRAADKVIVIGRCMARLLSVDGFDPKQITVIPNWPDLELLRKDRTGKSAHYSEHASSVSDGRSYEEQKKQGPKFRVLYAGNIGRVHPIDTILKAAVLLDKKDKDIEFVFVGDGANYDAIAKFRSEMHLDNIRLLPFQPASRLKELMESGDVHLVSMKEEAAGMIVPSKLYSAIAAERPCIFVGPAHCEVAKVLNDFKAGAVISQGDAEGLAETIRQMRYNSDIWFGAHQGAVEAAGVFLPKESINAWMERAWAVVKPDLG